MHTRQSYMKIVVVKRDEQLAKQAIQLVSEEAMLSWVLLFGGDRWHHVEWVAIAQEGEDILGLASLAPTDEEGQGGPHIIGVWVLSTCRKQGIGVALVERCAQESQRLYGIPATIVGVTAAGHQLAKKAQRAMQKQGGIALTVKNVGIAQVELP